MTDMQERAAALLRKFKGADYVFGLEVLDQLGALTAPLGTRALFVGHLDSAWCRPFHETALASLAAAGVEVVGMARGAAPNAPEGDVYRLQSHILHKKPQVVVVMGGGSTIDAVKAATVLAGLGDVSPELEAFYGMGKVAEAQAQAGGAELTPVVAVMTAASSAAHLTKYANTTNLAQGQKKLILDPVITPRRALFDYAVTQSQPLSLTLDGALDGIGHVTEVFFGASEALAPDTGDICQTALELIIPGVLAAHADPADPQARLNLGLGTDLGGQAIMLGGTSGPHLNSFSLVDVIAHGRACAVMNPYYTVFFAPAITERLRRVGSVYHRHGLLAQDPAGLEGRALGLAVAGGMLELSRRIGFPTSLGQVPGVTREHLTRCLGAAKDPALASKLANMPLPLTAELVDRYMGPVLEAAWVGDLNLVRAWE